MDSAELSSTIKERGRGDPVRMISPTSMLHQFMLREKGVTHSDQGRSQPWQPGRLIPPPAKEHVEDATSPERSRIGKPSCKP